MLANLLCWLLVYFGIQLWFKKDSLNSDFIRHFVLSILLRFIQVLSGYDQSTNHTLDVIFFTFFQFGVHLVMEQWFKQTFCDSYFTKIHSCISIIRSVNKSDTVCWILYCVGYWYNWAFMCDLRNTNWTVIEVDTLC